MSPSGPAVVPKDACYSGLHISGIPYTLRNALFGFFRVTQEIVPLSPIPSQFLKLSLYPLRYMVHHQPLLSFATQVDLSNFSTIINTNPSCNYHWASLVAQWEKESTSNGDMGLTPGLGRTSGEANGTQSSVLAWGIPRAKEPGGLQYMGLHRSRTWLSD